MATTQYAIQPQNLPLRAPIYFEAEENATPEQLRDAAEAVIRSRQASLPEGFQYNIFKDTNGDHQFNGSDQYLTNSSGTASWAGRAPTGNPLFRHFAGAGDNASATILNVGQIDFDPSTPTIDSANGLSRLTFRSDGREGPLSRDEALSLATSIADALRASTRGDDTLAKQRFYDLANRADALIYTDQVGTHNMTVGDLLRRNGLSVDRVFEELGHTSPASSSSTPTTTTATTASSTSPQLGLQRAHIEIPAYRVTTPAAQGQRGARATTRNVAAQTVDISYEGPASGITPQSAGKMIEALERQVGSLSGLPTEQREAILNARVTGVNGAASNLKVRDIYALRGSHTSIGTTGQANASGAAAANGQSAFSSLDIDGLRQQIRNRKGNRAALIEFLILMATLGGLSKEIMATLMGELLGNDFTAQEALLSLRQSDAQMETELQEIQGQIDSLDSKSPNYAQDFERLRAQRDGVGRRRDRMAGWISSVEQSQQRSEGLARMFQR